MGPRWPKALGPGEGELELVMGVPRGIFLEAKIQNLFLNHSFCKSLFVEAKQAQIPG